MKNSTKQLRVRRNLHTINNAISRKFIAFRQEFRNEKDNKHESKAIDYAEQWMIQKCSAEPSHSGEWPGDSYVTDRNKLIELSTALGLLSEPSLRAVLEALPLNANRLLKK
jgi:hypothetical protein